MAGKLLNQVGQTRQPAPDAPLAAPVQRARAGRAAPAGSGLTNTEIAARLFLSEGTVRNYVSAIFTKLGVSDRTQAAILALRAGLAELNVN